MEKPLIRDIASIQKIINDLKTVKSLKRAMPFLRPFLKLLGVKVEQIDEELDKLDEFERSINELANIPDRFNDFFADRGWVIYELMNLEVAKLAVKFRLINEDFEGCASVRGQPETTWIVINWNII